MEILENHTSKKTQQMLIMRCMETMESNGVKFGTRVSGVRGTSRKLAHTLLSLKRHFPWQGNNSSPRPLEVRTFVVYGLLIFLLSLINIIQQKWLRLDKTIPVCSNLQTGIYLTYFFIFINIIPFLDSGNCC